MQLKIRKRLRKEFEGSWWVKFWGGPFTPKGVPDLLGCVDGRFFALEVKRPVASSKPSPMQIEVMKDITKSGGVSCVVRSEEEAVEVVDKALASAKKSA